MRQVKGKMLKIKIIVFLFLLSVSHILVANSSLYGIPQKMNIQGRLVNKQTNQPLTTPTPVRFEIYSGGDEFLGGTLLYRENATVSPDVIGLFSHQIGSGQILLGSLSSEIFGNENIFLQIIINPDTAEQEVLQPRQKMASVSYAFVSELAETVPDESITTEKIKNQTLKDEDISPTANILESKLNIHTRYTDNEAVSAVESSGKFLHISTEPATQGQLILPSANPIILASAPDGQITLANDTKVLGTLQVGKYSVLIGTVDVAGAAANEIRFTNLAGLITGAGSDLTIQTAPPGNPAITIQPRGNLNLSPIGAGRIIFGANIDSDINFFGAQTINSNQMLNLNTTGNGPITTGTGFTIFGGSVQVNGNNILDSVGTSRISLGDNILFSASVSTFSGNVLVTGNNIQDSLGSSRLTLGDTTVISSSVTVTSTATIQGNLNVDGKIFGDGSGLTGIVAVDSAVRLDTGTLRTDVYNLQLSTGGLLSKTSAQITYLYKNEKAFDSDKLSGRDYLSFMSTYSAQIVSENKTFLGTINPDADLSIGGPGYTVLFASNIIVNKYITAEKFYGDGSSLTGITGVDALCRLSTGILQMDLNAVKSDTGTLRTDVYALQMSTGMLINKFGDTMIGILNTSTITVSGQIILKDGTVITSTSTLGGTIDNGKYVQNPSTADLNMNNYNITNINGIYISTIVSNNLYKGRSSIFLLQNKSDNITPSSNDGFNFLINNNNSVDKDVLKLNYNYGAGNLSFATWSFATHMGIIGGMDYSRNVAIGCIDGNGNKRWGYKYDSMNYKNVFYDPIQANYKYNDNYALVLEQPNSSNSFEFLLDLGGNGLKNDVLKLNYNYGAGNLSFATQPFATHMGIIGGMDYSRNVAIGCIDGNGNKRWGYKYDSMNYINFFYDIVRAKSDVYIDGTLTVSGTKNFIQDDPIDPTKKIVYVCLEGGEAGTYVRGSSRLKDGIADVKLPVHFARVTSEKDLTVQVTLKEECNGIYVTDINTKRIVVKELDGGKSNAKFDYLVQGVRLGYENHQPIQNK